jgi:hypothetical protein
MDSKWVLLPRASCDPNDDVVALINVDDQLRDDAGGLVHSVRWRPWFRSRHDGYAGRAE